jgi:ankyrin repeat protein
MVPGHAGPSTAGAPRGPIPPATPGGGGAVGIEEKLDRFTQAAIEGRGADAKLLLREPGFIHQADRDGHTALFGASCSGNLEVLDAVLALGPDVNRRDARGATPLLYAASNGKIPVVDRLLSRGADPNAADQDGKTPLIAATMMNQPEAVKTLLRRGAAIDAQDRGGATALYYAAKMGRVEIANLLVQNHANPALARLDGETPMLAARANAYGKIVELLREDGRTPF